VGVGHGLMRPYLARRLAPFTTTIFAEMSELAAETGAINLGQGFPDTDGPAEVRDAAIAAIRAGCNQYPPGAGTPELRAAVAEHQRRFYGLEYDPASEILVTAGATEGVAATLLALCEPGDEVVVFEPYYDSYAAVIAMAGASRSVVQLRPPAYSFDLDELAAACGKRARVLLLNSPHNPTGKVFDDDELSAVAQLCVDRDLIAVTDEVYEHIVFEGRHQPLAGLPGMRERTVSISSAGKTFSFTGWKIGWAYAPAPLIAAVRTAKQFLTFVNGAPFQPAVAIGLGLGDDYFAGLAAQLKANRDRLSDALADAGFTVYRPAGTYFVTVDIRSLGEVDGLEFCRQLPKRCGVVGVPNVVFYDDREAGAPLVRFAFCKRPEIIDEAATRLRTLAS
jgi:N-succinyldiaminopimelate aminotransferase